MFQKLYNCQKFDIGGNVQGSFSSLVIVATNCDFIPSYEDSIEVSNDWNTSDRTIILQWILFPLKFYQWSRLGKHATCLQQETSKRMETQTKWISCVVATWSSSRCAGCQRQYLRQIFLLQRDSGGHQKDSVAPFLKRGELRKLSLPSLINLVQSKMSTAIHWIDNHVDWES